MNKRAIKNIVKYVLRFLPKTLRIKLTFLIRLGYFPNLKKPRSFNEKVNYRKMYQNTVLMTECSDKLAVRKYVENVIGKQYLIPLLFEGVTIDETVFDQIHGGFVLKTTHDSGNVFVVKENESIDRASIVNKLREATKLDYGRISDEPWYSRITPKIIAEKLLVKSDGSQPEDYKFHVFNNGSTEPIIILQIDYDRFLDHNRTFYDREGGILQIQIQYPNKNKKMPNIANIECMYQLAEKLASAFSYARIDLYNVDGEIYFGEITFAHESGYGRFGSKEQDYYLGSLWQM